MDQPRYDTDLGHYCAVTGQLGRLTTLSAIPTVAGDTISIDMDVSARLTALRMPMVADARIEFGVFHVKHRNVYGELWEDLIKGGFNNANGLGQDYKLPMTTVGNFTSGALDYLAGWGNESTVCKHMVQGYNMIWNNYFRIPNVTEEYDNDYIVGADFDVNGYHEADSNNNGAIRENEFEAYLFTKGWTSGMLARKGWGGTKSSSTTVSNEILALFGYHELFNYSDGTFDLDNVTKEERKYGRRIARLPKEWNTGLPDSAYTNDEYGQIDTTGDSFDLLDVATAKMSLKSEIDRDWFTKRYRDFIGDTFGAGGVHIDADDRPELLLHDVHYMSGYDVDLTDDSGAGKVTGKSAGMFNIKMPPKFFNEHGTLWIMAWCRFPSIIEQQKHYLSRANVDYNQISGDPIIVHNHPPVEYSASDVMVGVSDSSASLGYHPYGQWYRWQPDHIHADFHDDLIAEDGSQVTGDGYPFIDANQISLTSPAEIYYDAHQQDGENGYTNYFASSRLAHWNVVSQINVHAKRVIPPASKSINAGV